MKHAAMLLISNLPSLAFTMWAGYLCLQGREGWGWFLLGGILAVRVWGGDNEKETK